MNRIKRQDLEYIVSTKLPWERLEGKHILISGANGFMASYIVEAILFLNDTRFKKAAKVFAIVRNKKKAHARFRDYCKRDDLTFVIRDVCVPFKLENKIDLVIHAAGKPSPKFYAKYPAGTLLPNVLGTYNLLELARKNKVEAFLFFSSGEIYGDLLKKAIPVREDVYGYLDPLDARSCYCESKRMGENMCSSWHMQFRVPVKIVRPFHTYGHGIDLKDGRMLADFISDVTRSRNIILKSKGDTVRTFCYIADAVAGFFTVLFKGEDGQAYNVGNDGAKASIKGLAHLLASLFPQKHLKVIMREGARSHAHNKSYAKVIVPNTGKIRRLGWAPAYTLKDGFLRTIESYA